MSDLVVPSTVGRSEPISMIRSTPPAAAGLALAVQRTLQQIADEGDHFGLVMRHRFGGTADDLTAAQHWFATRLGTTIARERLLIVNSAQNAMILTLGELMQPGDTLLVEQLSYHGMRKIAHMLGIHVVTVAMDEHGAIPEAFREAAIRHGAKALYLMPTLHNPTSIIMPEARRLALAAVARETGAALIEDDVYAPLPVTAPRAFVDLAADVTWHLTSFAKCIGPGLRVGYLVAPTGAAVTRLREHVNGVSTWFAAPVSADFVSRWVLDGTMESLAMSVRAEAQARQVIATDILRRHSFITHPESLFLWLDLPLAWSQDAFVAAAGERDVVIRPGTTFAEKPEESPHAIRIVLGSPDTRADLAEALTVLDELLQHGPGGPA